MSRDAPSAPAVQLVTGATGFIGASLVLELLERTPDRIVCLVRPVAGDSDRARSAQARLEDALRRARAAAGRRGPESDLLARCQAVPGDLLAAGFGVAPEAIGPVREVWHSAASLRFEDPYAEEIWRHNAEGTRTTLELARRLGATTFNYMSTAYVSGTREGTIKEELPEAVAEPGEAANNAYERSKIEAERRVAASGLAFRILRPSIVIGHSGTARAASDTGFYGYVARLARLRRVLERRGRLEDLARAEIEGLADAPLNLIPVDAVARNAVSVSLSGSPARIFHLTNATPPSVGAASAVINRVLGIPGPSFAARPRGASTYDRVLADQMRFFIAYVGRTKHFDRSNLDAAIGAEASRWPMDPGALERYVATYLATLPRPGAKRRKSVVASA